MVTLGDSITAGAGASKPSKAWGGVTAQARSETFRNLAYGSAGVTDYARQAYPGFSNALFQTRSPNAIMRGQAFALLAGYNDMRDWGTTAAFLAHFEATLSAVVGWLATPDTAKTLATDPQVRRTGDWQLVSQYVDGTGAAAVESSEINAEIEFELTGTALYICWLARSQPAFPFLPGKSGRPAVQGGRCRLMVDGVERGQLSGTGAFGNRFALRGSDPFIPEALDRAPHLVRLAGLRMGKHRVQLRVLANETPVTFLWAAGNDTFADRATLPQVLIGNTLRMTPEAYVTRSGQGSDAAVDAFHRVISDVCDTWFADGATVAAVDTDPFYLPESGVSADLVHPNDTGHAAIAAAFQSSNWFRLRPVGVDTTGGGLRLELMSEPGVPLQVEKSDDLNAWMLSRTLPVSQRITIFTEDNVSAGASYYRLRTGL